MGITRFLIVLCMSLTLAFVSAQDQTEFTQDFQFVCPPNKFLTNLQSVHSNEREDRTWRFQCGKPLKWTKKTKCAWTDDYINEFDRPMFFMCPTNTAIAGLEGTYSGYEKDRRFKVMCCQIPGRVLANCDMTDFVNAFDHALNFEAPEQRVITGIYSYHNDATEDRRYRFSVCKTASKKKCLK